MTYPPVSGRPTPREVLGELAELLRHEYRIPGVYGAAYREPFAVAGVLSLPAGITVWLIRDKTLAWRDSSGNRRWPAGDVLGAAGQLAASYASAYPEDSAR